METCRTHKENIFNAENLRNCKQYVFSMQQRLDRAVATNNVRRIRHILDLLTRRSQAVKILAVYHITKCNQGKNTAGIDGIAIPKGDRTKANTMALTLLNDIDVFSKPKKIRRVYIPKANGKKRPLGIPTLKDRINQEIFRMALEPIVEYYSHDQSFGFRSKRSCHDAIAALFIKLARKGNPRYVIEGDIKGCFDNISHSHITKTLGHWKVPEYLTGMISKMLKAKIFHNGQVYDNNTGAPQGGVISPLLANVALTALDDFIENNHSWKSTTAKTIVNPIIRYADDFIIVCKSKSMAKEIKTSIKDFLKDEIGLTLSEEKTKITHIYKGFDFLGFNIRKYKQKHEKTNNPSDYKLLIKPSKKSVLEIRKKLAETIKSHKTATQAGLIQRLNPLITGWANYHRYIVSREIFGKTDYMLWDKLFRWTKRRHVNKSSTWILRKYFSRQRKTRGLYFKDQKSGQTLNEMVSLRSKKRFVKVKNGMRIYCADHAGYWRKREYQNAENQLLKRAKRLFEYQNGNCPYCKLQIEHGDVVNNEIHIHHMLPRSFNGTESYSNLRLLHNECHVELHKLLSRKQMRDIVINERLDYINAKDSIISDGLESRVR